MTKEELYEALNYVSASRENRTKMASKIEGNLHLIPILIEIIKEDKDPISCKAGWVLESIAKVNLHYILIHIDVFTESLTHISLESSVRPASKICQLLVINEFSKKPEKPKQNLTTNHLNFITEAAFDWLIGNYKVAPKAYSMTTLLLIGRRIKWIHPELQQILKQNYESGSAAYKARARMTLKVLEKKQRI
ncbi:adenylosuccinate lyase [Maribacter sp. 1_MG-2023]|uniref:adenylosuccinate lyase n=1 Tax=Maribacter sp. 1_MG-2023 TaxID=3062677 RepID=UPI0026E192C9|nr:adenylosuccinate lyase [Maribacter sp. 1_MG-2023]MDO6471969.1 adenylosuccinate lyase [Maribacter sp. 1_MG-2023]